MDSLGKVALGTKLEGCMKIGKEMKGSKVDSMLVVYNMFYLFPHVVCEIVQKETVGSPLIFINIY